MINTPAEKAVWVMLLYRKVKEHLLKPGTTSFSDVALLELVGQLEIGMKVAISILIPDYEELAKRIETETPERDWEREVSKLIPQIQATKSITIKEISKKLH